MWELHCNQFSVPPSWSFIYGAAIIPPLTKIIECMETYHPSFPLPDATPLDRTPLTELESNWVRIKPVFTLLPQCVLELKNSCPLIKEYNKPLNEVISHNGFYIIPSPNREKLKKILDDAHLIEKYPEQWDRFKLITTIQPIIELKTNTSLKYPPENDSPLAVERTGPKPIVFQTLLSGPFAGGGLLETFELNNGILKPKSIPKPSFDERTRYVKALWPHECLCKLLSKNEYYQDKTKTQTCRLMPVDPSTLVQCGYIVSFPLNLCIPFAHSGHSVFPTFSVKFPEIQIPQPKWMNLYTLSVETRLTSQQTISALCEMNVSKKVKYSMQFYSNTFVVPFYLAFEGNKNTKHCFSKSIIPLINEYVAAVGNKDKINHNIKQDDPCIPQVKEFLTKLSTRSPWHAHISTQSLPLDVVREIEHNTENIKNDALMEKIVHVVPQYTLRVGMNVFIIDDTTIAPKGSTGMIIALDSYYKEAWLLMYNFNKGITFSHTLESYRGLIVDFTSIYPCE